MQVEVNRSTIPPVQLPQKGGFYKKCIKRPMDFTLSLLALIILSPLLLIIAILVRIKLGSPVIFRQKRPGLNEKIFTLYKFRTMTDKRDENGELLPDDIRLTRFGKLIRSLSLDELPELWNIIKGDMSIVGPRPQLVRDMVFMTEEQRKRHTIRPGLSGLAQVNGRNAILWEDKLSYDIDYLCSITFTGDIEIIFRTLRNVFARKDISTDGMETAEDFGDYLLRNDMISDEEYSEKINESKQLLTVR